MISEIKIKFDTKFTQKDLETYINNFWDKSFEVSKIVFDLSVTQWVNSEEITFLFSWVVKLKEQNKKIKIILPYSYDYPNEDIETKERRKFLKYYLLRVWGMFDKLGLKDLDFENIENYNRSIEKNEKFNFGKKIIPFQRIPVSYTDFANEKVDEKYNSIKSPENGVFFLEPTLIKFLNENECYSPFENKVISDIITKELVINSMEHTTENESFFTTALNDEWPNSANQYFIDHYKNERDHSTLEFYKDKNLIQKKINSELLKLNQQQKAKLKDEYHPSLVKYDDYLNQSFLEFTYIDFGGGIHSTLNEQFKKFKNQNNYEKVSRSFQSKNEHSQILEYAFLTESSKEPFDDAETRYNELVPRGLYFIVDMVRRYKGLLIARSGKGKVIYDFSNRIKIKKISDNKFTTVLDRIYVAKDAIINNNFDNTFFPGTMISIIVPKRKSIDFKKSSVRIDSKTLNQIVFNRNNSEYYPAQIFHPEAYEFLNLAFEYQKGEDESTIEEFNSRTGVIKVIFRSISNKLKELSDKNCVLFIDFEFIPIKDNNDILKILLYLSNNPMVNERLKVIVLNIEKDDIEKLKEYEIENFGSLEENETNFLFKPIPCLKVDKNINQQAIISDIQWIGVHKLEDLQILTNLFFGKIEFNKGISIDSFKNDWLLEGNVITKHNDRAYSIFTDFQDLLNKAKAAKTKQLEEWLLGKVIDGGKSDKDEDKFYFLTSKGSYQRKYLSLYETLNYKYTSRYFAQYLLDKYLDTYIEKFPSEYKIESKFNKIIVVTVSSQLLGVEIRNLIKDNENFKFLRNTDYLKNRNGKKAKISECPKLIKLASYFSFDSEKPFEDIKSGDKVLIVNDVISTGSLLNRIKEGVENREAFITGVLTIADSRKKDVDETIEYKSYDLGDFETKIISILSYENNNKFNLVKLINKPKDVLIVKRINPILNAVVSLESKHTETIKLLYENPEELITSEPFQNDIFRIGHFKQNITHNSYFTNMHNLFFDTNGEMLLKILKERIDIKQPKIVENNNEFLYSHLMELKKKSDFDQNKTLSDALNLVLEKTKNAEVSVEYKPKFIFHPVYSGIEEVSEDVLHEVFGTNKANIISLQRYETKNGWRFPFPAKRYNNPTKGAHILIIDSGALSGHSLVQLIDSISFLDVGRIDFLSVVGRIDDFQREFYSRLRTIRVKNFRGDNDLRMNSIVNLNIMFGINLHIPPSISAESCTYCSEIKKLEAYLEENKKSNKLPEQTLSYIDERIHKEIPLIEDSGLFKYPEYIPTIKERNEPDLIQIFNTRDKLGKVDSYRFYIEYFEYFDKIGNQIDSDEIKKIFNDEHKDLLKQIELILICVLHEPHLVNVLKDLLASIYEIALSLIDELISVPNSVSRLNYNWSKYALVKIAFSLKSQNKLALYDFYHFQYFGILFNFSNDCDKSLNFLSFLLSGSYYELKGDEFCTKHRVKLILDELKTKHPGKGTNCSRVLNELIKTYDENSVTSINAAVYNLYTFFKSEEGNEGHTKIQDKLSKLRKRRFEENIPYDINNTFEDISFLISVLKKSLFQNLEYLFKKSETKEWFDNYFEQIFGEEKIFYELSKLCTEFRQIKSNKNNINVQVLKDFSEKLTTFNFKFLIANRDNWFYMFCESYRTKINEAIVKICKENKNLSSAIEVKLKLTERDNIIYIPMVFLEMCITEILKNASQKKEKISSKLELVISTEEINPKTLEFKVYQNENFDKTSIIGGFFKTVKPILSAFGQDNSFEIIDENEFTFKTNFSIC